MKMKFILTAWVITLSFAAIGQNISHKSFDALLQKYVSASGTVNYKGLKKDEAVLESYIGILAKQIPDKSWSRDASLAYWINAYNALTLKLIVTNYPVKSITNLNGGKPWDVKWIDLAGKKYSLNNIENDIIRPQFKDPRIHFAVNCGAVSCPPLSNTAFTETNINKLLDSRSKAFINSASNEIACAKIKISKIFDWYKADFGDVIAFINKYSTTQINVNAAVEYGDYNWNLNEH